MAIFVVVIGWIVLLLLGAKALYSVYHFAYSVYLSSAFGHSLDPRRYGPWAGKNLLLCLFSFKLMRNMLIHVGTVQYSYYWSNGRTWGGLCTQGSLIFHIYPKINITLHAFHIPCLRKLAALGMNIVLISRTHSKLQEVAYEISEFIL